MKRALFLILPVFLMPSMFFAGAAAQGPQGSALPVPADYPAAGATCKVRDTLVVKVTSSFVDFPNTAECELLIHAVCGGEMTTFMSGVRGVGTGVFDDFFAAQAALQGLEICCDPILADEAAPGSQSSGRR